MVFPPASTPPWSPTLRSALEGPGLPLRAEQGVGAPLGAHARSLRGARARIPGEWPGRAGPDRAWAWAELGCGVLRALMCQGGPLKLAGRLFPGALREAWKRVSGGGPVSRNSGGLDRSAPRDPLFLAPEPVRFLFLQVARLERWQRAQICNPLQLHPSCLSKTWGFVCVYGVPIAVVLCLRVGVSVRVEGRWDG